MSQTKKVPKLTIKNRKPGSVSTGANTEVLLDGHPIQAGLTFLKVEIKAAKVAKITMEMLAELDIEVEGEPQLKLKETEEGPAWVLGQFGPKIVK